ncbi:sulfatase [Anatilimnocola sp. NA78]|uniref:sulfatase family protein n=1 Tax=Anatilimnocola sp. NA78 TaxID=3415683 RepID=UPI003CE58A27
MNRLILSLCLLASWASMAAAETKPSRPNILWFVVDDMSANFSCYGEKLIETPHVDRLAKEGTRFSRAFITAPVCSPCRSALITGMFQTTIGSHHHRSGRGSEKIHLPTGVTPIPVLFQQAGYFTCIGSGLDGASRNGQPAKKKQAGGGLGKTDYNFEYDPKMYDAADWSKRKADQPFFMQVQLAGGKLRGGTSASARKLSERAQAELGAATKPANVTLPPYYPRDEVLLEDWAAYLDSVRFTDQHVGKVLDRLKKEGLLDSTLVVFMTDHGISHARGKQFLYNEGTHVPLIVRGPDIAAGVTRDDLVQQIDLAPLSLAAADIEIPKAMQGSNILAKDYRPRDAVFAARDRCDETVEQLRSVRTDRWLYIRNGYPNRPALQPNAYKDGKSILQTLRQLHEKKQLSDLQEQLLFAETRPKEELYDWQADPHQLKNKNLAADAAHQDKLLEMRGRLDRWIKETGDLGQTPESESRYDSDMANYLGRGNPAVEKNIALMKKWAKEGK